MNPRSHLPRLVAVIAVLHLPCAVHAAFEPPPWAGQPNAEVSEWLDFTTAFGEPGNPPDVAGSNGDAVLRQLTPGAMVTGTKNIYNPAGASVFTVSDSFTRPPEVVVFETRASGTELDVDSVRLEFNAGGQVISLGTAREELSRVTGGFGDTVESRWTWNLRGRDAADLVIRFASTGAHCSLVAARLDVRFKPDAASLVQAQPANDRWSYPFNATPGTRAVASTFQSADEAGLTRHGFLVLGFDTAPEIEAGRGTAAYEIISARVTLMTSANFEVTYDPTADAVATYLTNGHPQFLADEDAGRPLELFGAGFRNGQTAATWTETAPYAPADGERSVYPIAWTADGAELDASTNVNFAAPYEALPFAVGAIATATPGENVPHETPVVFELDLSLPGVKPYLQSALNTGKLIFSATSLHAGGQGVRTFPEYYTRDSLLGDAPRLELTVRLYERTETVIIQSIQMAGNGRTVRFPTAENASYGIRWSTDLKSWQLVRDPVLTTPEPGVAEWTEEGTGAPIKFYQIYRKP